MSKNRKSSTFYFNTNSKKKKKSFWRPKVGWKLTTDAIPKIMDFTPKICGIFFFLEEVDAIEEEKP